MHHVLMRRNFHEISFRFAIIFWRNFVETYIEKRNFVELCGHKLKKLYSEKPYLQCSEEINLSDTINDQDMAKVKIR
jgi:hypothetical protein